MPTKKKVIGRPAGSKNQFGINLSKTIQEIITKKGRFMHHREIVTALSKKAGTVKDPVQFALKTSVLLYTQKRNNALAQHSEASSTRDKYYGLPEWLNKRNGKPVTGKEPKI